jgi:hypothetical protein
MTDAKPAEISPPTTFISHASDDRAAAEKICRVLEADGISCWIAPRDVALGRDYAEQILDGIESTRVMVLLLSSGANASSHVKNEVERAISKGKVVIPFRIENVQPSRSLELFVSRSQWIDAWTPPLEARAHVLAKAIRGLLDLPPLQDAQSGAEAAAELADGRVLVAGGENNDLGLASADLFDPATGSFSPAASMTTGRWFGVAVALTDGRVLVAGGLSAGGSLKSAELYWPAGA